MSLTLRTISREQHLAYIQTLPAASHMQVPAWADVKAEWRSESLGWFDDRTGEMVGSRPRALPPAPQDQAVPGVPPRGPGDQLVLAPSGGVAPADAGPPQAAGRLLGEDGPAGDHPALGGRQHQEGHPGPGRQAPAGRGGGLHRAARLRGGGPAAAHGVAAGRGRRRGLRRRPAAVRLPGPARQPFAGGRPQGLQPALAAQHQEGREGRLSRSSRAATRTWRSGSASTRSRPSATASARAPSATSSACGRR